jgi:hypothetical protein
MERMEFSQTYVDGNELFEETGEMFKIRKISNNVIRENMNIKNSV